MHKAGGRLSEDTYFADASLEQGLGREHPFSHGRELHVYSAAGSREAAAAAAAATVSTAQTIIFRSLTSALPLPAFFRTCCWPSQPGRVERPLLPKLRVCLGLALPLQLYPPPRDVFSVSITKGRSQWAGRQERSGAGRLRPKEEGGAFPSGGGWVRAHGCARLCSAVLLWRGGGVEFYANVPRSPFPSPSSPVYRLADCSSPIRSHQSLPPPQYIHKHTHAEPRPGSSYGNTYRNGSLKNCEY